MKCFSWNNKSAESPRNGVDSAGTSTPDEDVARCIAQIQRIATVSPTAAALICTWIERLIDGEPLEAIKAEMDRLDEVFTKQRRR